MKYIKLIQGLSAKQLWWVCSAYWRLLNAQLRIKLKQQSWLREKLKCSSSHFEQGVHSPDALAPQAADAGSQMQKQSLPISSETKQALEMHEAVRLAAKLQFWTTQCLPRSIVLVDMLKANGFAAALKLGISKDRGLLSSHAWVEINGQMIGEPDSVSSAFIPFGGN